MNKMFYSCFPVLTLSLVLSSNANALWTHCFEDAVDPDNLVVYSYAMAVDMAYESGGNTFEAVWIDAYWDGSAYNDAARIEPFTTGTSPKLQGGWGRVSAYWDYIMGWSVPGTSWDDVGGIFDYNDWTYNFHANWKVEWDDDCDNFVYNQP